MEAGTGSKAVAASLLLPRHPGRHAWTLPVGFPDPTATAPGG